MVSSELQAIVTGLRPFPKPHHTSAKSDAGQSRYGMNSRKVLGYVFCFDVAI